MKNLQIFLMSIFIIYLQVIWLLLGFILIPIFCIIRGLKKMLDSFDEYEKGCMEELKALRGDKDE